MADDRASYEKRFSEWLARQVSPAQLSAIYFVFTDISEFCLSRRILKKPLFETDDLVTLADVRDTVERNKDFAIDYRKQKIIMVEAIRHYCRFIREAKNNSSELDSENDSSDEVTTLPPSEIEVLLSEEIFAPLKLALEKESIRTIEDLRALKLWAFMNKNNIYSISMRQTVLDKVRRLLEPATAENRELPYELHCGSTVYYGDTIAKTFLQFCEATAKKNPLFFRRILDKPMGSASNVIIYRHPGNGDFIRMENPICYVSADLAKDSVIAAVEWLVRQCLSGTIPVSIKEPGTVLVRSSQGKYGADHEAASDSGIEPMRNTGGSWWTMKVEKILRQADTNGMTYDDLRIALNQTIKKTEAIVRQCKTAVEIKGKLYHEEAFADWDDGAKRICRIMEKLMQINNGYISAAQLYNYARAEMNMFLNDNALNDECSVYEIAQHLFEKNSFEGNHYVFTGNAYISRPEGVINNKFDIICKFAEEQGGVFQENDLTDYLTRRGIKVGNIRNQMRLGKEPEFFFYEPGTIISAKSMGIDDSWKESVRQALNKLFSVEDDHIVLRQIQPVWYESLPALPEHRIWTPLLLQYVLQFYGQDLGAKTIMAMKSQSMDTLHAMLVKIDSPVQNFGDAVIACLIENETEQRCFEAEELRQFLVKMGMIHGNELIWNMPKELAKDERFAWDVKGENVTIRVG